MTEREKFEPRSNFTIDINRSERCYQVRYLAPLLELPEGCEWLLNRLNCPCQSKEALKAEAYHLCFPLKDIFTKDYYQCRIYPHLQDQFIAYYNDLFDLPKDFGAENLWKTAPNKELRHPGAPGRAGWHEEFLLERVPDPGFLERTRNVRRMLGTEADVLLLTKSYAILLECKYLSTLRMEQYKRQMMMGQTLAKRLGKKFHFGMILDNERDPEAARIIEPYVLWKDVKSKLELLSQSTN